MVEFPILTKQDLDPAQREFWDELTLGPRGFYTGGAQARRLPDLYNTWMQFPQFGQLLIRLGDEIRAQADLPGKLRELVVLTTSAYFGARVEFDFHVPFALNEGLTQPVITALAERTPPPFTDATERLIFEANLQLIRSASLTESTRSAVADAIGLPGLMQLIAVITLYVATAYTVNVARVKLADDFSADPEKLKDFFAGKPVDPEPR